MQRATKVLFDYTSCRFPHVYFAIGKTSTQIGYSNKLSIKEQLGRHKNAQVVIYRHDKPKELVTFLKKKYFAFQSSPKTGQYYSCGYESASHFCRSHGAVYSFPMGYDLQVRLVV